MISIGIDPGLTGAIAVYREDASIIAAFKVIGLPAPQGSKSVMPGGHVVEGASSTGRAKHKSWRTAVAETAEGLAGEKPHDGPLQLEVVFRMPMPSSRPARARKAGEWPKSTKPDLDKLIRALCDGLTESGLICDDARIFRISASKVEVVGWTGAEVILRRFEA